MHPQLIPYLICALIGVNLVNVGAELAEGRGWLPAKQVSWAALAGWVASFGLASLLLL